MQSKMNNSSQQKNGKETTAESTYSTGIEKLHYAF